MTSAKLIPESNQDVPLAIVGMGCLFPKADGLGTFWANIKNGVDGIGPVPETHWRPHDYFDADPKRADMTYARRGGFLDPYPFSPAEFGIAPRDLEAIDTAQLLGLVVAKMALEDAGLLAPGIDRSKVSVILGVTGTLELVVPLGARLGHPLWRKAMAAAGIPDDQAADAMERISRGYVSWQENSFPGLLGNVVAGRIANRLNLGGTNCVVDAACASSLSALHLAALELRTGKADAVLTGGVDTFNDIFMYMCFSKTPALSPTGDARPFADDADGTILGEGLGMLVLKRLPDAERNGDRIYAVIRGIGTSSDGAGNAVYAPTVDGQRRCLADAYHRANVPPATVDLIEAHGTGTKVGDAVELEALIDVYAAGTSKRKIALGSVKSQIGHTKAAAGAAGLIKAALALHNQVLPPTIKVKTPAAPVADSPFYVNAEPRPWLSDGHRRRAAVSSFGFGGSNFHCVLEEHRSDSVDPFWDGNTQIASFSAPTAVDLRRQLDEWAKGLTSWRDVRHRCCELRKSFQPDANCRLLLVMRRDDEFARIVEAGRTSVGEEKSRLGAYIGRGARPPLGLLFPGQGSQSVGMMRDLACTFPVFRAVLAEADRAFAAGLVDPAGERLSDIIYPPAAFTAQERERQELTLRETSVAQPALGAVSLASLHVLRGFGIVGDVAAGHSYGELTALCAAGCYDAPSLFAISQLRGRLMAQSAHEDRGAMLAVMAPIERVEAAIAEDRVGVVIANRNAPAQAVLSGPVAEIRRAEQTLTARKLRHLRLPVAAAFHSPLVADAAKPFRSALEPIDFHLAQLPVFANSTSREYPRDPQAVRDLLAAQLANPVDFVQQIHNMYRTGVRTFVEVGPGVTLSRLTAQILADEAHETVALDGSAGRGNGVVDFAHALARLAAEGQPVRLAEWDPRPPAEHRPRGPVVPICGANYRPPQPELPPRQRPLKRESSMPESAKPNPISSPRADASSLQRALQITQDSLAAFQKLQEQTAELHRVFLEQQTAAQQTLQSLLAGQQQLLAAGLGAGANLPTAPTPPPPRLAAPRVAPVPVQSAKPVPPPHRPAPQPAKFVPPPPPVVPPPAVAPVAAPAAPANDLLSIVLAVVAEKTGYPIEMLDPDMGMDSDLGIDSIKRVEILSAVQEHRPELPPVPADRLGSLRTLREVVNLLEGAAPLPAPRGAAAAAAAKPQTTGDGALMEVLLEVVADKTGYPVDMIDVDMGLDADLGIDSIKRVEILSALQERLPGTPSVPPERLGSLRTLREVADFLLGGPGAEKKNRQPTLSR